MVASKYEEIYPPPVSDFVYISANTYTSEQIVAFELEMLAELDFSLTVPTVYPFVKRLLTISQADPADVMQRSPGLAHMLFFLAEASMLSYQLLSSSPSKVAAAATFLGRLYLAPHEAPRTLWTNALQHYSSYAINDVAHEIRVLNELVIGLPTHKAHGLYSKYESTKLDRVSPLAVDRATALHPNLDLVFM